MERSISCIGNVFGFLKHIHNVLICSYIFQLVKVRNGIIVTLHHIKVRVFDLALYAVIKGTCKAKISICIKMVHLKVDLP